MAISKANIGNALTSVAPDHVVAVANDIYDETLDKYQSDINAELDERVKELEENGGGGATEGQIAQITTNKEDIAELNKTVYGGDETYGFESGSFNAQTGAEQNLTIRMRTSYLPVNGETTYELKIVPESNDWYQPAIIRKYDSDRNDVGSISVGSFLNTTTYTFDGNGYEYVRIAIKNKNADNVAIDASIIENSVITKVGASTGLVEKVENIEERLQELEEGGGAGSGATEEQIAQIETNKTDIAALKKDLYGNAETYSFEYGSVANNGAFSGEKIRMRTGFLPVNGETTYEIKIVPSGEETYAVAVLGAYDSDKIFIEKKTSGIPCKEIEKNLFQCTFNNDDYKFVSIVFKRADNASLTIDESVINNSYARDIAEKGLDTKISEFEEKVENIETNKNNISELNKLVSGVHEDFKLEYGTSIASDGSYTTGQTRISAKYVPVVGETTLYATFSDGSEAVNLERYILYAYDKDKQPVRTLTRKTKNNGYIGDFYDESTEIGKIKIIISGGDYDSVIVSFKDPVKGDDGKDRSIDSSVLANSKVYVVAKGLTEGLRKEKFFPGIAFWGSSSTEGAWVKDVANKLNLNYYWGGVGGEFMPAIMARMGVLPMCLPHSITIPADTTPVELAPLGENGESTHLMKTFYNNAWQDVRVWAANPPNYKLLTNPCYIAGIEGEIIGAGFSALGGGAFQFQRLEAGEEKVVNQYEPIFTRGFRETRDCIWFLACHFNGVNFANENQAGFTGDIFVNRMLDLYKKCYNYSQSKKIIILGRHRTANKDIPNDDLAADQRITTPTKDELEAQENALFSEFGLMFFNTRQYMCTYGFELAQKMFKDDLENGAWEITEFDRTCAAEGIPPNCFYESAKNVHFNSYGYAVLIEGIVERIKSLGYTLFRYGGEQTFPEYN